MFQTSEIHRCFPNSQARNLVQSFVADLPHADWNKDETLRQLEELLPHLLLPDPEPAQSTDWDAACAEVWQFVEMVVESGEGNNVELYSR